ncbi:uncharacterized protein TNCV_2583261 [Trichonephila clavipes]|nr:uncharacterized protein TNCV_2583261 [Trichonephila clavipes]
MELTLLSNGISDPKLCLLKVQTRTLTEFFWVLQGLIHTKRLIRPWVGWWLEHRTPDQKAWVQCPMPPNTLRVHSEYVLVKSVGPKVLWAEPRVQGTGEYFPPLQSHGKIVEVEIGVVALYRPFRGISPC